VPIVFLLVEPRVSGHYSIQSPGYCRDELALTPSCFALNSYIMCSMRSTMSINESTTNKMGRTLSLPRERPRGVSLDPIASSRVVGSSVPGDDSQGHRCVKFLEGCTCERVPGGANHGEAFGGPRACREEGVPAKSYLLSCKFPKINSLRSVFIP